MKDELALRVPGVHVALDVVGDDVDFPGAEEVTRGRSLEHGVVVGGGEFVAGERFLAGVQWQRFGVHRPAGQVAQASGCRVVLVGVDEAVGVGDDQLV